MSGRIVRGGPVRARDLRANIQELGFEQGVVVTMERFLDEFAQHRQQQRELVQLVDRCIDEVAKMINIGTAMRTQIEEIKRVRDLSEEHDHDTH